MTVVLFANFSIIQVKMFLSSVPFRIGVSGLALVCLYLVQRAVETTG